MSVGVICVVSSGPVPCYRWRPCLVPPIAGLRFLLFANISEAVGNCCTSGAAGAAIYRETRLEGHGNESEKLQL